jgi:hypothetical protein
VVVISLSSVALAAAAGACRREPAAQQPEEQPAAEAQPVAVSPPTFLLPSPVPLPEGAYRVEWVANTMPQVVKAGSHTPVKVTVRNVGNAVWPDVKSTGHRTGAVRIGYRWLPNPAGSPPPYARVRGDLAAPVPPGQSGRVQVDVLAPAMPGAYKIQFDLVQEFVIWFELKGAARLVLPVRVEAPSRAVPRQDSRRAPPS